MYNAPSLPLPPSPAPVAAGYTNNHTRYKEQFSIWSCKASGVKEEVSIKVFMGHIPSGKRNIKQIGVSDRTNSIVNYVYVLTHDSQDVVEGFDGVDMHIGADKLHRWCYDALQWSWLEYTCGYQVPLANTTLRGVQIHAPIAGKALLEPAKSHDAIWHFVCKLCGGSSTAPKFRAE